MKKLKRLFSLILVCGLLLSVTGCGSTGEKENTVAPSGSETVKSSESTAESSEDLDWLNPSTTLPLVKEGTEKTLSLYTITSSACTTDAEDLWMYQYIENAMNINLDVTLLNETNAAEVISLAFASGDLPDIIIGYKTFSTAELISYGAEGMLVDMAPYIEKYMPNMQHIFSIYPDYESIIYDTEGHVWSLPFMNYLDNRGAVRRIFANYDWLEALGYEDEPDTLDELLEVLRAMKAENPDSYPMGGSYSGNNPGVYLLGALGYVTTDATGMEMALRNGEAVLPVADREAYGAYLEFMHTLYEEELIHPDYFTMTSDTEKALVANGQAGFISAVPYTMTSDFSSWWACEPLTSDYNSTKQWPLALAGNCSLGKNVVTSACEDIELAATFLDYWYSNSTYYYSVGGPRQDETDIHYGFSEENKDFGYVVTETYSKVFPIITNDTTGKWTNIADYHYKQIRLWDSAALGACIITDPNEVDTTYINDPDPADFEKLSDMRKYETMVNNGELSYRNAVMLELMPYTADIYPPYVWLDEATSTEMNNLLVAIKEYATQETAKFITGARSLDELDTYFDEIDKLGAAKYVETYSDYYDLMNSK